MPIPLYLDAARMGRMSPSTQWASQSFVRFAGEYGGTLYFENFLHHGFSALPEQLRRSHSGLISWKGIRELRETLNAHVELSSDALPLLANRTANLVRLAAKALCADGRRVLITDLTWPSYARILRKESARRRGHLVMIPLRGAILRDKLGPFEVADFVADVVERFGCNGLFLPAVSHDGIRFPLELLSNAMRRKGNRRFLAVDGAQAFCHVPLDVGNLDCDFLVTGSHKWLGAYLPLGIAFVAGTSELHRLHGSVPAKSWRGANDPLHNFLAELECNSENRFGETVNMMPLFSCRAALLAQVDIARDFTIRKANASELAAAVEGNWRPELPHAGLQSGILLLKATSRLLRHQTAASLRANFLAKGISLSTYEGGFVRLSMPDVPFSQGQLNRIAQAFGQADDRRISSSGKATYQESNFGSSPHLYHN